MSLSVQILMIVIGVVFAIVFGVLLAKLLLKKYSTSKLKENIKNIHSKEDQLSSRILSTGIIAKLLAYCNNLSIKMYYASKTKNLTHRFVHSKKLPPKIKEVSQKSGMTEMFNNFVYRECQIRLALIFFVVGFFIGIIFSNMLGILLGVLGFFCGLAAPGYAMKKENELRNSWLEHDLPEMLEVLALGLRSGLTFDRSFQIYIDHFDSEFSYQCSIAINKWQNGISSRVDALKSLSKAYDSKLFSRVVEIIIRSLRFGTSAVDNLEQAASDARAAYKTKQEEAVAKAPVKMMIPTGVLILPAMLLLVLGPVLLELSGGF